MLGAQLATLSFVTPTHVGIEPSLCAGAPWASAVTALRRATAYAAPPDIMSCVAAACGHLASLLQTHDAGFVRLAALCVLGARPPALHSHLEYAARFVDADCLWDGNLGGSLSIVRAAMQWVAIQDPSTLQRLGPAKPRAAENTEADGGQPPARAPSFRKSREGPH